MSWSNWSIVADMNADAITGERVHILLRRGGIKQEELAGVLGLAQTSLSRKLLGKRSWTLDELLAAAHFFDVPVTELLPGDDYDPMPEGRGRVGVGAVARLEGLEPPTFWLVATDCFWTPDRVAEWLAIQCQAYLDAESRDAEGVA